MNFICDDSKNAKIIKKFHILDSQQSKKIIYIPFLALTHTFCSKRNVCQEKMKTKNNFNFKRLTLKGKYIYRLN